MRGSVDSIKERLDIVEVLSSYLKLEKAGVNFKGKCPFHNEKTASFMVSPSRQRYYCFGCGAKGDIFTFVQEQEGMDFKGSLRFLAERAGIEIEYSKGGPSKDEKDKFYKVLEDAAGFFEAKLAENESVREYIALRGIHEESIKAWRLGFAADDWRVLYAHLTSLGYSKDTLIKAGLIKQGEDEKKEAYDVFRGRIMFPLMDTLGRVVAFSGRAIDKDNPAKYLNTPETLLFNKSELLYGLDKAKDEIRKKNFAVLVEGQIDLVLSHQVGVRNTVASSGTAFTQMHLERLKKLSPRIILAFDGDSAGEKAAEKSAVLGLSLGMEVKIAKLPDGKDPADIAKEGDPDGGVAWKNVLREAHHAVEYSLDKVLAAEKDARKAGKAIEKKVLPLLSLLTSSIEKSHFVSLISKKSGIKEEIIWDDLRRTKPPNVEFVGASVEEEMVVEDEKQDKKARIVSELGEVLEWLKIEPQSDRLLKQKAELERNLLVEKLEEERKELRLKGGDEHLGRIAEIGRRIDEERRKVL
jgi:DNA primase